MTTGSSHDATARAGALTGRLVATAAGTGEQWLDIALSTRRCDRAAAVEAVREAYLCAGLVPPARIVWAGSPLAGMRAHADLGEPGGNVVDRLWDGLMVTTQTLLRERLGRQLRDRLWREVYARLADPLRDRLQTLLWMPVQNDLQRRLVDDHGLDRPVPDRIGPLAPLRDSGPVGNQLTLWFHAYRLAATAAMFALADLPRPRALEAVADLLGMVGGCWPQLHAVVLTERPAAVHRDERGRLHCTTGPALRWPDGYALHLRHGVPVSEHDDRSPVRTGAVAGTQADRRARREPQRAALTSGGVAEPGTLAAMRRAAAELGGPPRAR